MCFVSMMLASCFLLIIYLVVLRHKRIPLMRRTIWGRRPCKPGFPLSKLLPDSVLLLEKMSGEGD